MKNESLQHRIVREFSARGITLATAESCTGGLIAKLVTDIPGSSSVLLGGCVTYTNEVKIKLLGVDPAIIDRDTEVSHTCAKAMAQGARALMGSDIAVSTTGYAGPGGGTERDPVDRLPRNRRSAPRSARKNAPRVNVFRHPLEPHASRFAMPPLIVRWSFYWKLPKIQTICKSHFFAVDK